MSITVPDFLTSTLSYKYKGVAQTRNEVHMQWQVHFGIN